MGLVESGEPFESETVKQAATMLNDSPEAQTPTFWSEDEPWQPWLRSFRRRLSQSDRVVVALSRDQAWRARLITLVLMARFFGKPVALWYRNPCLETSLETNGSWLKHLAKAVTMVVCPDKHSRQLLREYDIRAHIVSDFIWGPKPSPGKIRALQPRILATAPVSWRNDLISLEKAFALVKQKYPRAELMLVTGNTDYSLGDPGPHEGPGESIRYAATPAELNRVVDECDLYVCTDTQAIRPPGLLRAMAAGRPVICSELGSVETLIEPGEHGLTVPINQPAALAEMIIRLIESPDEVAHLAEAARQRMAGLTFGHARATWRRAWEQALGADQATRPIAQEQPASKAVR